MKWAPPLLLGGLLACLTTLGVVLGEQGTVVSSDHDLAAASTSTGVATCEICHLPHDASGDVLWPEGPRVDGDAFSGMLPLCYSCHDGTVTSGGTYAFDESLGHHPIEPGKVGGDCDRCHDPHVPEFGSFLIFPAGANFCRSCHAHASDVDHPVNIDVMQVGSAPYDGRWDPDEGDFSGTRLWDKDGLRSGSYMKCLSCHAGHGTDPETPLLTMGMDEYGGGTLCLNCHPQ